MSFNFPEHLSSIRAQAGVILGLKSAVQTQENKFDIFHLTTDELSQIMAYLKGISFEEQSEEITSEYWFTTQSGFGDGALSNLVIGINSDDPNTLGRLADTKAWINNILGREADLT